MKKMNKKGISLGEMASIAIIFVVVTIVISIGAEIVGDIRTDQTTDSTEYNVTTHGLESLDEFGDWLPTLAIVIVAAIIIGIITSYFAFRGR